MTVWKDWQNPHPLDGVFLKVRRANKHLETLNALIEKYQAAKPYTMRGELNPKTGFFEYRLVALFPPFLDFGIAIGEFAYQLRSALDQMIFSLAVFPASLAGKDLSRAHRSTSFPICLVDNPTFVAGQLKFVPDAIRDLVAAAIDPFQPYHGGDTAERWLLAVLEEIYAWDKHRIPKPAGGMVHINTKDIPPDIHVLIDGNVDTGDVFALVKSTLDPKVDFEPRVTTEIKVDIPRPVGGVGVTELWRIYEMVEDGILPAIAQFHPPRV